MMIRNIIFSFIFVCLCIASALYLAGFERVEMGVPFMSFMYACNNELNSFLVEIPDIPLIPSVEQLVGTENVVEWFSVIFNVLINFFNAIIQTLNILADIINILIQLIEFLVIVIKNLVTFKDNIIEYNTSDGTIALVSNLLIF